MYVCTCTSACICIVVTLREVIFPPPPIFVLFLLISIYNHHYVYLLKLEVCMVRVTYALNLLWSPTAIWEQFGKVQTAWADYTCSAPLDRSWHISRHTGHVWCMWCMWCVRHMCGVCGVCCTNHGAVVATISFSPSLPTCAALSIYQCVCKSVSQTWVVINFDHAVRLGQVCVTRLGVYRSGKLCGEQGRRGQQASTVRPAWGHGD